MIPCSVRMLRATAHRHFLDDAPTFGGGSFIGSLVNRSVHSPQRMRSWRLNKQTGPARNARRRTEQKKSVARDSPPAFARQFDVGRPVTQPTEFDYDKRNYHYGRSNIHYYWNPHRRAKG